MKMIVSLQSNVRGFSLFELTIVTVVIAFLIAVYMKSALSPIAESQRKSLEFQANTFSRAVANLHGLAVGKKLRVISQDDLHIFVNEFGWPANTSKEHSPLSTNQTPEECLQLWEGLFRNPPHATISNNKNKDSNNKKSKYEVYGINGHICRYQLTRRQEGLYFFDYDLKTGTVIVSVE